MEAISKSRNKLPSAGSDQQDSWTDTDVTSEFPSSSLSRSWSSETFETKSQTSELNSWKNKSSKRFSKSAPGTEISKAFPHSTSDRSTNDDVVSEVAKFRQPNFDLRNQSSYYRRGRARVNPSSRPGKDIFHWGRPRPEHIANAHLRMTELYCSSEIKNWIKRLRIFAWLLMADGGLMSIGIFISGSNFASFINFRHFIIKTWLAMWLLMLCAVQPILTSAYCLFAISNPRNLRPYYLRSSLSLGFPTTLIITASWLLINLRQGLKAELTSFLKLYHKEIFSRLFWNRIQTEICCCGIENQSDWRLFHPEIYSFNGPRFPDSCCDTRGMSNFTIRNCSMVTEENAWPKGCFPPILIASIWIGASFLILSFIQALFQFTTIVHSRWIYKHFESKLNDGRNAIEICLGPLACFCTSSQNQFDINDEDIQHSFPWLYRKTPGKR